MDVLVALDYINKSIVDACSAGALQASGTGKEPAYRDKILSFLLNAACI